MSVHKSMEVFEGVDNEARVAMLRAMGKYLDNHWWESEDLFTIAIYQLFEEVLLVGSSVFCKGVELLLDRHIHHQEFYMGSRGLKKEAFSVIHNRMEFKGGMG